MARRAHRWVDVRAEAVASGRLDEARVAELGRKMRAEMRAYRLKNIRQTLGLTKTEMGERIGVSRSQVSRIERGELDGMELATLRAYVGDLGGELEIMARFGDERFTIA